MGGPSDFERWVDAERDFTVDEMAFDFEFLAEPYVRRLEGLRDEAEAARTLSESRVEREEKSLDKKWINATGHALAGRLRVWYRHTGIKVDMGPTVFGLSYYTMSQELATHGATLKWEEWYDDVLTELEEWVFYLVTLARRRDRKEHKRIAGMAKSDFEVLKGTYDRTSERVQKSWERLERIRRGDEERQSGQTRRTRGTRAIGPSEHSG